MATTWALELHTGAGTFVSQTRVPSSDDSEIEEGVDSSLQMQNLADGGYTYSQPEITYKLSAITLNWSLRNATTLFTRIENYIKSGSGLRITTHTDKQFTGVFTNVVNRWRVRNPQKYDVEAEFQQIETQYLRDQQW